MDPRKVPYTKNGKTYITQCLPYCTYPCNSEPHFVALAEDGEGEEYILTWPLIDPDIYGTEEGPEDDSDACDWTNFTVHKL